MLEQLVPQALVGQHGHIQLVWPNLVRFPGGFLREEDREAPVGNAMMIKKTHQGQVRGCRTFIFLLRQCNQQVKTKESDDRQLCFWVWAVCAAPAKTTLYSHVRLSKHKHSQKGLLVSS